MGPNFDGFRIPFHFAVLDSIVAMNSSLASHLASEVSSLFPHENRRTSKLVLSFDFLVQINLC